MMAAEQKARVEEAIFRQKFGTTQKRLKAFKEFKDRSEEHETMLVKKARVDLRSTPRWARIMKKMCSPIDAQDVEVATVMYSSRKITCTQCQHQNETALMQLRTTKGFRAIHCARCGAQTLAKGLKCTCGVAWHLCEIHRTDPGKHRSRKAPKADKGVEQMKVEDDGKSSKRKAPDAIQRSEWLKKPKVHSKKKLHVHGKTQELSEPTRLKEAWQIILNKRAAIGTAEGDRKRERVEDPAVENKRAVTHCTLNWRVLGEHACKYRRLDHPLREHLKRGNSDSADRAVGRLLGRPRLV